MLEVVWRKGNPLALLVGMQIDIATMENRLEVPELPYDLAIPLLGIYPEKTIIQKDTCKLNDHHSTIYNSQDIEAT